MITASRLLRLAYCVEFVIFALPIYLLAVVLAPFGAFVVAVAPVALPAYTVGLLIEPSGIANLVAGAILVIFIASAYIALWYLAKLSLAYVRKGENGLRARRRDFVIGGVTGGFAASSMALAGVAFAYSPSAPLPELAVFGLGLPPFILVLHLWIAKRQAGILPEQDALPQWEGQGHA